jgi:hypothetical protein
MPRFVGGARVINKHDSRRVVVDMDAALDMVEEYQRGSVPIIFNATAQHKKLHPFEIMQRAFGICPGAFQWDEITGRVIETANLYHESKPPPDKYDRRMLGLVQIAAGSQAEYYKSKMPKDTDSKKTVKGK